MREYVLSPAASRDIEDILSWTQERLGEQARLRYEALLARAIQDVLERPDRGGSIARPEIHPGARSYHLVHSRMRVKGIGRVKQPRHFLPYRMREDRVEIGRVLHDSMELKRHLPEECGADDR